MSLVGQVAADVVDGEVLLAKGDDVIAEGIGFRRRARSFGRYEEEVASRVLAKLVDEDAEAPWGIAKAARDLDTGEFVNEEGAQGLVLAVRGVGWLEEDLARVR
jgi:hypothetical protein